jgi:osmoprotectant transport system permease protein
VRIRFDKLGVVIAVIVACGICLRHLPRRIVPGEARSMLEALPTGARCC